MDALAQNLEQTRKQLEQFIQQVKAELDSKNATLREYEQFFQKCESVLPTFNQFVTQVFDGLKGAAPSVIEIPVEVIKEVVKEVPVEVIKEVEVIRVVEKEVIKEVIKEIVKEVPVEVIKEVVREVYVDAAEPAREPRAPRERSPRAPRVAKPKAKAQSIKNVLVVDDAEINRVLMGHYFKALPIKIEFSNSGQDAIQKCQSRKFDLILMDLQMKDMGGIETAQQIRSFEKATPIFAITNTELNSAEEQQALGAGCNRYLSKGISKESLQDQVSETLFGELLLEA